MKLFTVDTINQALEKLYSRRDDIPLKTEKITIENALYKVISEDVVSAENIPGFYRSTVDGYAVKSSDTQGATESIPTFLKVVDEVKIGTQASVKIKSGQCAYVPTGAMIPEGADSMVMIEYTEAFSADEIAVYESVAYGKNVVVPGEDIKQGEVLIKKGTVLKPEHIGALAAAGVWEVNVFTPWKVSIISTGNELVNPNEILKPGQVRDVNTWALKALALQCGFEVVNTVKVADDENLFKQEIIKAKQISDIILTSGGSSQGKSDMTNDTVESVCDCGVLTHGLSIKPGKPTIIGFDKSSQSIVLGLPGHPVAALVVFQCLAVQLWKKLTNQPPQKTIFGKTEVNIAGAAGKTTFISVKTSQNSDGDCIVTPVLGRSGLINTLVGTDGYIVIDMNKEGLKKGETVEIYRFGL